MNNLSFNEKNPADHPMVMKVTKNGKTQYVMTNLPVCSGYQAREWIRNTHVLFSPVKYDDGVNNCEAYNAPPATVKAYMEDGIIPVGCCVTCDSETARAMFEILRDKSKSWK